MLVRYEDDRVVLDSELLSMVEEAVYAGEGARLRVSLCIVADEESRRINREFLSHDYETDVIAFDLRGDAPAEAEDDIDGELVVNAAFAEREGTERGHGAEAELLFYVVHGLLHLLGYDDHEPEDRARMLKVQQRYLARLGIEIRDSDD